MKKYKVIWFDDEHELLGERVLERAHLNDIELIGFANAKDGIEELEKNIRSYDAAIVDGIFLANAKESGKATSDKPLFEVANAIQRLNSIKVLPWFILSGQPSFIKEKNRFADGLKDNKVYDKTNDEDLDSLWNDLKACADIHEDTQLRHNYSTVFDVCTEKYIGNAASKDLFAILKKENALSAFNDPSLYFNPLRKIMEDFFMACNKWGLLPDVFVKGTVALNESSKFMSGAAEKGYQYQNIILPKVIIDNVKNILAVCQPAAHRSHIDSFVTSVNSPYLLLSITYQLLDVLLWFKIYIDQNNDVNLNKSRYKQIEVGIDSSFYEGIIKQDTNRNFYCGEIILTYKHVKDNGYKVNDLIRILKTANNTNERTMGLYPKSAISSEKI